MGEIRIYVEGGGDGKTQRQMIRLGFQEFLKDLRSIATGRHRWQVVACGSRDRAFDCFCTALGSHPLAFNVLLVDSEGPVPQGVGPWSHLSRRDPQWHKRNPGVPDEHYHLMAQMMEAWFLADPDALERYYGQRFFRNALPRNQDVEQIQKTTVETALQNATRHTQKGQYRKISHGGELLALVNATEVRRRARHCDRLFTIVEHQMTTLP